MRSGAPSTVSEAVEPANMPISKPRLSAMRAEIGSKTEPGWTQASPARMARKRSRRVVQFIAPSSLVLPPHVLPSSGRRARPRADRHVALAQRAEGGGELVVLFRPEDERIDETVLLGVERHRLGLAGAARAAR